MELCDLVQQFNLACRIIAVLGHDFVDADLLLPIATCVIDRFENVGNRELVLSDAQHAFQSCDGIVIRCVDIEDLTVCFNRRATFGQVGFTQLRQAHQQRYPLIIGVHQQQLTRQVVAQIPPLLGTNVQAIQRLQRTQIVGLLAQDFVIGRDGFLWCAKPMFL